MQIYLCQVCHAVWPRSTLHSRLSRVASAELAAGAMELYDLQPNAARDQRFCCFEDESLKILAEHVY